MEHYTSPADFEMLLKNPHIYAIIITQIDAAKGDSYA